MLSFAELKTKPFIQRAIANPSKPGSVLSFFFAVDYDDTAKYKDTMLNSAGTIFANNEYPKHTPKTLKSKISRCSDAATLSIEPNTGLGIVS